MRDNSGKIILALLAGASAGVIAGLLMAPDTGEATRDTLRKTASNFGKDVESRLQPLLDKLTDLNAGELLGNLTGGSKQGGSDTNKTGAATPNTGASNAGTTNAGTTRPSGGGVAGGGIGGATTSGGTASSGGGAGIGGGVGV